MISLEALCFFVSGISGLEKLSLVMAAFVQVLFTVCCEAGSFLDGKVAIINYHSI